jgi:hypothetical protein
MSNLNKMFNAALTENGPFYSNDVDMSDMELMYKTGAKDLALLIEQRASTGATLTEILWEVKILIDSDNN